MLLYKLSPVSKLGKTPWTPGTPGHGPLLIGPRMLGQTPQVGPRAILDFQLPIANETRLIQRFQSKIGMRIEVSPLPLCFLSARCDFHVLWVGSSLPWASAVKSFNDGAHQHAATPEPPLQPGPRAVGHPRNPEPAAAPSPAPVPPASPPAPAHPQ
jgi:hypothetical protein